MTSVDDLSNTAIDFNEIDLRKLKAPLKSLSSGRELSAGGGQATMTTSAKSRMIDYFSIYDSIGL
jgi:hypothetical protein